MADLIVPSVHVNFLLRAEYFFTLWAQWTLRYYLTVAKDFVEGQNNINILYAAAANVLDSFGQVSLYLCSPLSVCVLHL